MSLNFFKKDNHLYFLKLDSLLTSPLAGPTEEPQLEGICFSSMLMKMMMIMMITMIKRLMLTIIMTVI
jgi:hypothetical protein